MVDDASTRFPFISLEKAIGRAQQLYSADKNGKPMLATVAFDVWEYSPKSSGAFQTVAALKQYGLIYDDGSNVDRRIGLTDEARRYFLDERDTVRSKMLEEFALKPALFRVLWTSEGWSAGIPADTVARSHLKIDRRLNEQSARSLLGILKDNIRFAGLKSSSSQEVSNDSQSDKGDGEGKPETDTGKNTMHQPPAPAAPPATIVPPQAAKPIMFDMESITVSARFDNVEDLREFIEKLQKLEPLMPTKQH